MVLWEKFRGSWSSSWLFPGALRRVPGEGLSVVMRFKASSWERLVYLVWGNSSLQHILVHTLYIYIICSHVIKNTIVIFCNTSVGRLFSKYLCHVQANKGPTEVKSCMAKWSTHQNEWIGIFPSLLLDDNQLMENVTGCKLTLFQYYLSMQQNTLL